MLISPGRSPSLPKVPLLAVRLLCLCLGTAFAVPEPARAQAQEAEVFAMNAGFSGISAAIGSVINKPRGADWKKYFVKGLWQGGVGGIVAYSGKRSLYLINKYNEPSFALPSRILHYAGLSMIENAAQNRPFLDQWHINYGPARFDYSIKSRTFRARVLPYTFYSIYEASGDGTFDLKTTLLTGTFAFRATGDAILRNDQRFNGLSQGNAFAYLDNPLYDKNEIIAHELVHNYQYEECQIFNSWLIPPAKRYAPRWLARVAEKYVYADIPYFLPLYWLEDGTHKNYNCNYFEVESYRISTSRQVLDR